MSGVDKVTAALDDADEVEQPDRQPDAILIVKLWGADEDAGVAGDVVSHLDGEISGLLGYTQQDPEAGIAFWDVEPYRA